MEWNAIEIRQLRYRLGWSRAELARRVGCELTEISAWEAGEQRPATCHCNNLENFLLQAESYALTVQRRPVAELLMNTRGLEQINDAQVIASLAPQNPKK